MVESGGVEPHPLLQRNLVFKTSRRTISPASLSMSGGNGRTRTYDRYHMKVPHWPLCYITNKWRTARDSNPEPLVLETRTLPIELAIHYLVEDNGFEPMTPRCKRGVFPIILIPLTWRSVRESNPSLWRDKPLFLPMN